MARTIKYKDVLNEELQGDDEVIGYLNAALEDEDPRVFLLALRDVADARGGVRQLAEEGGFNRESLYRILSEKGNPRFDNLKAVLEALGLHLSIHPAGSCLPRTRRAQSRARV